MKLSLILCIVYAGLIFGASSVPGDRLPGVSVSDFLTHAAVYAGFGAILFVWLSSRRGTRKAVALLQAVALASLYGLTDEWHQSFVPGRTPDPADWVADTVGAVVGSSVFVVLAALWACRRGKWSGR